jgi:hypothetical protein
MPYESEMEEEVESEEEVSEEAPEEGEKKDYTQEEMVEYLVNEAGSSEEFMETLDKHGWELRKKEGPSEDFDSIEKELGMHASPPKLSVIRLSSARKALNQSGKRK